MLRTKLVLIGPKTIVSSGFILVIFFCQSVGQFWYTLLWKVQMEVMKLQSSETYLNAEIGSLTKQKISKILASMFSIEKLDAQNFCYIRGKWFITTYALKTAWKRTGGSFLIGTRLGASLWAQFVMSCI